MGTSTRVPGPRAGAGPWRAAHRRLRDWQRVATHIQDDASAHEAAGIRSDWSDSGRRLEAAFGAAAELREIVPEHGPRL